MRSTPTRGTTPAVAICDGSGDFASDRYGASSVARYDANLDANTHAWLAAHPEAAVPAMNVQRVSRFEDAAA